MNNLLLKTSFTRLKQTRGYTETKKNIQIHSPCFKCWCQCVLFVFVAHWWLYRLADAWPWNWYRPGFQTGLKCILSQRDECLIYVANMSGFFLGCFNFWYESSEPYIAEIFNAIFNILARSVLVLREIKSHSSTASFLWWISRGVRCTWKLH